MKMKIKIRDLTKEQFQKWKYDNCNLICTQCPFAGIGCTTSEWINHKNIFNNKFLKQTIEYTPDILDKKEHDYLAAVIKPFRNQVRHITKVATVDEKNEFVYICIRENGLATLLPYFPAGTMYKGMEVGRGYNLEELGL